MTVCSTAPNPPPAAAFPRLPSTVAIGWRRLTRLERLALCAAQVVAVVLLWALVQTCQEQVRNGEQLRAEQRQMVRAGGALPLAS